MANLYLNAWWRDHGVKAGATATTQAIDRMSKAAGAAAIAFAGIFTAAKIGAFIKDVAEEEDIMRRLNVTLRNVGTTSNTVMPQLTRYFEDLQKTTTHTDDEIAAAFDAMVQGSGDAAGSLKNLVLAMNVSAAKGMPLVQSGEMIAQVMQGIVRTVGMTFPQLRKYSESLESIADPAERTRLMLEKLNEVVKHQEEAKLEGLAGQWSNLTHQMTQFFEEVERKHHVVENLTVLMLALRNINLHGFTLDPNKLVADIQATQTNPIPGAPSIPGLPGANNQRGSFSNPFDLGRRINAVIPGAQLGESAMGSAWALPMDRRMRGAAPHPIELSVAGLEEARDAWDAFSLAAKQKFMADQEAAQQALGESLKSSLIGAFEAATQGGKSMIDFLKNYFRQALIEFGAGSLVNLAMGSGTVGTGIIGKLFSKFQGQAASGYALELREARMR